jgi:SAM-dependent methyltransferase
MDKTFKPVLTPGGPALSGEMLKHVPHDIRASKEAALLFLGCRFGENALAVAKHFAGKVIAGDEDTEAIYYAKMELEELGGPPSLSYRTLSPAATALMPASMDVVFLEGVLSEHSASKVLSEAKRVLKPGGSLCLSDSVWLQKPVPSFIAEVWEAPDRKVPTLEELEAQLKDRGFEIRWSRICNGVLDSYYRQFSANAHERAKKGFEGEKHMKHLIKHYKHEIDTYEKFGGRDFMGYGAVVAVKV